MSKNKVVIYNTRKGGAKVFVTDDPDSIGAFADEIKFVNPDLSFVADIPPELWNLEDGNKFAPIFDEKLLKERIEGLGARTLVNQFDADVKKKIANLVEIPEALGMLTEAVLNETSSIKSNVEASKKEMFDEFRDMNLHFESRFLSAVTMHKAAITAALDTVEKAGLRALIWIGAFLLVILSVNIWQLMVLLNK